MGKGIFGNVLQVCVVVRDVRESMRRYNDDFGIGPWELYEYSPENTTEMQVHGKPRPYSMRIAAASIGDVQWELVEPLDGKSIYAEFLEEHGEGLHHIAFDCDGHDATVQACADRGAPVIQAGRFCGYGYTYLDTRDALGFVAEIYDAPDKGTPPKPLEVYPDGERKKT